MRDIVKQLGYPLIFASMVLFGLANRAEGMWLNWLAAAVMGLGMLLFVLSAIFPPEGSALPPSRPGPTSQGERRRASVADFCARASRLAAPGLPDEVPAWAYLLCGAISAAGAAAFVLGPNGVSPRTVISFAMIPGGAVLFFLLKMIYGGARAFSNMILSVFAVAGFLLVFGAIMTYVLFFAGAFDGGAAFWLASASVALLAGAGLAYYGMKYQQGSEGVAIGRELGFQDAQGGLSGGDGVYDSKGAMNGVEVMFNVEQEGPYKRTPAHFRLEVLCACANPRGLRLEIQPDGFLNFSLSGLPKAPHVDYWDNYDIRANLPDVAAGPLAAAKAGESVFCEQAGFSRLTVDGNEMKLVFELEGYAGTSYVRRVLIEASRLAAALS